MWSAHYARRTWLIEWLRPYRYLLMTVAIAVVLSLSAITTPASAQKALPPFLDPHVNDYAGVLTAEQATEIRTELSQFKAKTGVQVVVATVNSVQDYAAETETIESFATNLFNTWGIGDRARNDGILLLVAPGDRELRIELGSGYSAEYDRVAGMVISDYIVPRFKQGDMGGGVVAGVDAIIENFVPGQSPPITTAPRQSAGQPTLSQDLPVEPLVAAGGIAASGGGVGFAIYRQWHRYRKRNCPECQTEMVRLSEHMDDKYLEVGQRKEESLKSVDYDIWLCRGCGYHSTHRYPSLFSQYGMCSSCQHKTLHTRSTTVRQPTYTRTGERRIDEACRHCSYERTYYRTIPMLERDDDDSSSGSSRSRSRGGGGRSSGGGASGSW